MDCCAPGLLVHHQLPQLAQTHVHRVGDAIQHLILCCSRLLLLQSFPASGSFPMSQFFTSRGQSIRASASVLPVISFRIDWFDLPDVQGTFKRLLQHHNSKASILWCSAFIIVQLSHPYVTTGKIIALTRQSFVGKVKSLLLICCLGWS